jgi:hypothetical protein
MPEKNDEIHKKNLWRIALVIDNGVAKRPRAVDLSACLR